MITLVQNGNGSFRMLLTAKPAVLLFTFSFKIDPEYRLKNKLLEILILKAYKKYI